MHTGRPAAFAALAALVLSVAAAGAGAQASREGGARSRAASASVARALLDEARLDAGIGDWEGAYACLGEAISQDPGDADARYLRALSSVKKALPLDEALADLDFALATGRFSYYGRREASTLKAELLVRERRWAEALGALGGADPSDPAAAAVRARAYAGLGDSRALVSELSSALRRFPDATAFARLFLARAGKIPESDEARALGELVLGRLRRYAESDPELLVLAAPLMPDIGSKRDAVLAFRATGGSSPAATLRALEYGLIDEARAGSELLRDSGAVGLEDLSAYFSLAGSPAGREAAFSALAAWSGRVELDSDADGISEGHFTIAKGLVREMGLDSGQRGIVDLAVRFANGLPSSLTLLRGGVSIGVEYSNYPAVASIAFSEGEERRGYSFGPESLAYAPIAMRSFAGVGRSSVSFPYPVSVPDPGERECASSALGATVEAGGSRRVTVLDKGMPASSSVFKGGRLYSTTSYSRGRPTLERIDSDGDGRFETERLFFAPSADGDQASRLRMDADGDGVYEYAEESAFPFRKEWDFDGDGSVDATQAQLADGSTAQEFSSRLDGRLDERIVVKEGRILSLMRDGAPIPLVRDSDPRVTWIGRKPFDLGPDAPAGEGIFSEKGKRYRLTRVGDQAFAELVP